MDKAGKIVAAAILAASISQVTPAFAVTMTAEQFVGGLSSDFAMGNYASIQRKLDGISAQGFEGVRIDDWSGDRLIMSNMLSVDALMQLLAKVQSGQVSPGGAADQLRQVLNLGDRMRFVAGGKQVAWVDPDGTGNVFPAGSAA